MNNEKLLQNLKDITQIVGFDFSANTTYGLGGKCRAAFVPKSDKKAMIVFDELNSFGCRYKVLGKGSNVLASDIDYDGYILSTASLKGISRLSDDILFCSCGTSVSELLNYCIKHCLCGAEFLYGIPASLGGVAFMNGGAGSRFIGEIIQSVIIYDGKIRKLTAKQCHFSYKYSTMRDINAIILGVIIKLERGDPKNILQNIENFKRLRSGQPRGKSCGCVFKNHNGIPAGKIIDECGLKGAAIGGAVVSGRHANFILNRGATAFDVYNLIMFVKRRVLELRGINLEEEVCYIGDFYETYG